MRKLIAGLLFMMMVLPMVAQDYVPTKDEISKFFKTTTLVVLEDNPMLEYNIRIKEVMNKEWTVTPFKFITVKEFEEKMTNPEYSFLVMTEVTFEKDKSMAKYKFLNLLLGDNVFSLSQLPTICSVPLAYYGVEESSYIYKLNLLARFIQNHVQLIQEHPEYISANIFKHYNDNMGDIKHKTLYLVQDELEKSINSAARIHKIYPYKFKIVTREDIQKAIEDRDPDVVFLHKVGPEGTRLKARCYKVIIGAADAQFYYFDYHKIDNKHPDGLLESDLKKMARGK